MRLYSARRREERRIRKLEKLRITEEHQRNNNQSNAPSSPYHINANTNRTYSNGNGTVNVNDGSDSYNDNDGNGNGNSSNVINHDARDIDPLIGRRREHTRHVKSHHHYNHNHDLMPFGEPYVM
jgi:hypothetical protein